VLLGADRGELVACAALGYCIAFWSSWIVAELVRKRTEWIAVRAARDGCDRVETRRRLRDARSRINSLVRELSHVMQSIDYAASPSARLNWLPDPDDLPVMQTALAAAAQVLVTDNSADFPLGETRNGVLLLGSQPFLARLYERFPDARTDVLEFLTASAGPPRGA
jgi:hypothetical protein